MLVPEYHKKGGLHFHALINDVLPKVDSGTISLRGKKPHRPRSEAQRAAWLASGGRTVYNLSAWGWGFSTAIYLYGDRAAAVGYVTKYITKAQKKIGGRWYYSGGELRRPVVTTTRLDFDRAVWLADGEVFNIDELGASGVRLHITKEEFDENLEQLCGAFGPVFDPEIGLG